MTERRKEVGACGHFCVICLDYRALAEDDDGLRRQVAAAIKKEMNIHVPLHQVGCEGCWGNIHNAWTASLACRIRQCVEAKGFVTCVECQAFPCAIYIAQFAKNSRPADNIRGIRQVGLDSWLDAKQRTAQPADPDDGA